VSNLDDIFYHFAASFAGRTKDAKPICVPEKLSRSKLNLRLSSLALVDEYLAHLHGIADSLVHEEIESTILYGGAYAGEVIRNETNKRYDWIEYEDYMAKHPELRSLFPDGGVATCVFLVDDTGNMIAPLVRIVRSIFEGDTNSVEFFASCAINSKNPS
jgi:hypothetical protein